MFTKDKNRLSGMISGLVTITIILLAAFSNSFGYDEVIVLDREPYDYRKMWVTPSAVSRLNADLRVTCGAVFITVELSNIRYRIDGGEPDGNDGHPLLEGQNLWLSDSNAIENLRMVAVGAGARVVITYYR